MTCQANPFCALNSTRICRVARSAPACVPISEHVSEGGLNRNSSAQLLPSDVCFAHKTLKNNFQIGKAKACRCPCSSLSCSLASHLSSKVQMKPFKSSSTEYCKLTTKLATTTTSSKASRVHKIHVWASAAHHSRCRRCRRCRLCSRHHRHHIHAMAAICCRHLLGRCCRRHRRHLLFMTATSCRRHLTCRC